MNDILKRYVQIKLTGNLKDDITALFTSHQDQRTLNHVLKVASTAINVAKKYGADPAKAEQAALLHDISNVIPVDEMLEVAKQLNVKVEEEEYQYSRIIHQKLSRAMAEVLFGISDQEILAAIECHTTLKPGASQLDKVLFISDKISWDLRGEHPYLQQIEETLERNNMDEAILIYLNHIWEQRDQLKLVHSWLIEAREELLELTGEGHEQIGNEPLQHQQNE